MAHLHWFASSTYADHLRGIERAFDRILDDREIGEQVRAGARRQAFHSAHAFEASVEQSERAAEIPGRLVGDRPDPLECAERTTGQLENQPLRAAALDTARSPRLPAAPHPPPIPPPPPHT